MPSIEDVYQSTLNYLYSFVDYSLTRNLRYSAEKFNLERMRSFMRLLGDPHLDYPIVHVAGTKGKGSICALIANVLKTAKYRTGLYTSPHLQEFTERIKVNDINIEKNELNNLVDEIKPFIGKIKELTTFEITTALAFLYFSREKVDIAVIEVGLGGRLDATNIVNPLVSIISTISKDHVKILGNTLEKIAIEKAGIIKNDVPVIVSFQKPRVNIFLKKIAQTKNSIFYDTQKEYKYKTIKNSFKGQEFFLTCVDGEKHSFFLPLLGVHQIQNAITAYSAIQIIKNNGFIIDDQNIYKGFATVDWPGRFEILREKPFLIIDSAHNVDSIIKLVNTINLILPKKEIILIFGASEDKDIDGMLKIIIPRIHLLITTQSIHPRALEAGKVLRIAQEHGKKGISIPSIEDAFKLALEKWTEKSVIIATGSIFVAAAIRELWISKYQIGIKNK
jgi:dihydrofolate synthase / folylpolyglutamate synthase